MVGIILNSHFFNEIPMVLMILSSHFPIVSTPTNRFDFLDIFKSFCISLLPKKSQLLQKIQGLGHTNSVFTLNICNPTKSLMNEADHFQEGHLLLELALMFILCRIEYTVLLCKIQVNFKGEDDVISIEKMGIKCLEKEINEY